MLEITHLTRRYGSKTAVSDLTFSLSEGETCALLGPNGSGKTTLMKMIAGLVQPTSGQILVDNQPVGTATKAAVAYMPTENYFYNYMTLRDAGRYYADFFPDFDPARYDRMLSEMSLNPKDKIRQLSSGMSAKLRLALILCRDAKLMMFDEPLNGVDILTRTQVISAIASSRTDGRAMLISTHLVDELEAQIDRAGFMKDGQIVLAGTRDELRQKGTLTELYLEIYGNGGEGAC